MRTKILISIVLLAACTSKPKAPAQGSKELMNQLAGEFRAFIKKEYPGCESWGTGVTFDGKAYGGRAFNKPSSDAEGATLIFTRDGESWKCVDADSTAPGGVPACAWAKDGCKR